MNDEIETHLWDVQHAYYCNDTNFYSSDTTFHYHRWQEFIDEEGDADFDMNLLFRWDWQAPRSGHEETSPLNWQGDEYYRDSVLSLYWIGQRKGLFRSTTIDVCRADEPMVVEFLRPRWEHLQKLWRPISPVQGCDQ